MKILHLLYIFILNFKFIFCLFPAGNFLFKNQENQQYLTAGTDGQSVILSATAVGDSSKWKGDGKLLINVGTGKALQVNAEVMGFGSRVILTTPNINDVRQQWDWVPNYNSDVGIIEIDNGYYALSGDSPVSLSFSDDFVDSLIIEWRCEKTT
ncbi:unnamed protein product [Cunninghamella blakesleeana]